MLPTLTSLAEKGMWERKIADAEDEGWIVVYTDGSGIEGRAAAGDRGGGSSVPNWLGRRPGQALFAGIQYCWETDIPTTSTGDDDSFSILLFFTLHSAVQVLTLHRRFPAVQSDADIESSGILVTKIWCDKVGFDTMVKMCMANGKRYWRCKISKQNPKH
ncbi:hypothetical protein BDZ91DRAFT_788185 [Kalaharituber pfeilii]|nr:hypothetical protein BDZ91DRAFT_788185 [Kalaharituber pfeilii]